jgi:glucose-6-phosphate isomerase
VPERKLSARYPTDLPAWKALKTHQKAIAKRHLRELFAEDPQRFDAFSLDAGDLQLDYSKNCLTAETRDLLVALAREAGVDEMIAAMFSGEHINVTEDRAVLHVALRAELSDQVGLEEPGVSEVWRTLNRIEAFVGAVQSGEIRGGTGQRLTNVVNIGIGGSDLGPVMASRALRACWLPGMHFHSVSNVDGTQLADIRAELDPETTLFIVCSKTFTTQETMTNAHAARRWIVETLGEDAVARHFAAASTNHTAMDGFGIDPGFRFGFWDWVGGRYSLWSAVGLSLALVIGMDNFRRMLAGGRRMDRHFRQADLHENMPALLALIGIWYNNFFGAESQAILPYDNRLDRFPAYLQQLQMESSGKRVRRDGKPVRTDTGMVIWGEAGNNAQHSFYQLLHQGTRFVPVDFLLPVRSSGASQEQQDLAIANCLAQSEALMEGHESDDPYRVHPGGRPSNTILFESLTPEVLGQLIALYEHKVFVENAVWGVNAFDQFGVELGKKLAKGLEGAIAGGSGYAGGNDSTRGLIARIRRLR